jgi:hypothetical protein
MAPLRSDDHISALELLIRICHADENPDEAEAYSAILFKSKKALESQSATKEISKKPINEDASHRKDAPVSTGTSKLHVQQTEAVIPTFAGSQCAVCEEPLEHTLRGERILNLSCGHFSHEACFYEYIKEFYAPKCPTCNAPLSIDTSRADSHIKKQMPTLPVISEPKPPSDSVNEIESSASTSQAGEHLASNFRKHVRGASESGLGAIALGVVYKARKSYKDETSLKEDYLTAERFVNDASSHSQPGSSDSDSVARPALGNASQLSPTYPQRRRSFSSIDLGPIKEGDKEPAIMEAKQSLEKRQDSQPVGTPMNVRQRYSRPFSPLSSDVPHSPPPNNTPSVSRPNLAQLVPNGSFGDFAYAKKTYRILIVGEPGVGKTSLIR